MVVRFIILHSLFEEFLNFRPDYIAANLRRSTDFYYRCRCWWGYNLTPSYWFLEGPRLTIILVCYDLRILCIHVWEQFTNIRMKQAL